MRKIGFWLSCWVIVVCGSYWLMGPVRAEVTESQRKLLSDAFEAHRDAGAAFKSGDQELAVRNLTRAMRLVGEGLRDADPDVYEKVSGFIDNIEKANVLFQLEGMVLPPFERPVHGGDWKIYAELPKTTETPTESKEPTEPKQPTERRSRDIPGDEHSDGISFVNQVAPLLVNHCGKCHVTGNRGDFVMDSYAALMRGPAAGVVVFAGDPVGSRLIETIETGDMPRGGGKVPAKDLQLLKDWVSQGANFDGTRPGIPLAQLGGGPPTANPSMSHQPATMNDSSATNGPAMNGSATVSFAKDVAPLLVENCNGCHLDAMQTRGGLNMTTLAQLIRGGDSGDAVTPGDGDRSLLVRKLRGQEGVRMPGGGRPPLAEESIQLVSKWIDEGAKLDGGLSVEDGPGSQPLRTMVIQSWARNATPAELAERRKSIAEDHWKLGVQAEAREYTVRAENEDVLVVGNVSEAMAARMARLASEAFNRARSQIPLSGDRIELGKSKYRGRVTLFLFPRRYDYSEFAQMVEKRTIPSDWDVHWQHDGVDAYVAMLVSEDESDRVLMARLVAPLASLAIAELGESPHWFRTGVGMAVAAQTVNRDFEGPRNWDKLIPEAIAVVKNPKELLDGKLPPEQADLVGYAIGKTLLDRKARPQFQAVLKGLAGGASFEDAFAGAVRVPLENFVNAWFGYQ